ncbi:MAG: DUF5680 domain-containing protein [Rhodoferax sp.]
MQSIASSEFLQFLVAAKQATYAGQSDTATLAPLLPGSKQLEFAQGRFLYRDVYVGMVRFVGQEIVYCDGEPVWSMSYAGGLLPQASPAAAPGVYAFLRRALRALPPKFPIRGPALLEAEGLCYACQHTGTMDAFQGDETVSEAGAPVYALHFAGGRLV